MQITFSAFCASAVWRSIAISCCNEDSCLEVFVNSCIVSDCRITCRRQMQRWLEISINPCIHALATFTINIKPDRWIMNQFCIFNNLHCLKIWVSMVVLAGDRLHTCVISTLEDLLWADLCIHVCVRRSIHGIYRLMTWNSMAMGVSKRLRG